MSLFREFIITQSRVGVNGFSANYAKSESFVNYFTYSQAMVYNIVGAD